MIKSSRSLKILFLSLLSVLLIACGGGGGGGGGTTPTPTPSGGAPTINFVTSGTITKYLFLGENSYQNPATSPTNPNGTITYASSNTSVATIDALSGTASLLSTGTTTITATVTADGAYTSGSNSYTLVVSGDVPFTAWIGVNDSKIDFPAGAAGLSLYSHTDRGCRSCVTPTTLGTGTVTDTLARLNTITYFWLFNNTSSVASKPATISQSRFSARMGHELIAYQNSLWLVGGYNGGALKDLWSSSNGEIWTQESSTALGNPGIYDHQLIIDNNAKIRVIGGRNFNAGALNPSYYTGPTTDNSSWGPDLNNSPAFGRRSDHQVSTFNGKHWLTGGSSDTLTYTADTWSSTDGIIWTQASPATDFTARRGHQTAEFNGKLWLIGGYNGSYLNDIWSYTETSDTWTQETASATFSARRDHRLIAFNNKLWLIGGESNATILADIWSSTNGTTWVQETAAAAFGPLYDHSVVVFNDRLWVAGGKQSTGASSYSNEVWSSADGSIWIQENSPSEFTGRSNVQATSFLNKLWLFGGESNTVNNDIWSSSNAINWTEQSRSTVLTARTYHQISSLSNKLWLSGGLLENGDYSNEAMSSTNGTDWVIETPDMGIPARIGHQMVSFNNLLWILGGRQSSGSILGDAWVSSDGKTWGSTAASFGNRWNHQSVVFNSKLWVIGGNDGTTPKNDVWSYDTTNGWIERKANNATAFSARSKHEVVAFGSNMWLIGGQESGGGLLNDIWNSADGVTWTRRALNAEFPARHSHSVVEHGGELYLIGGVDANGKKLKDVWKSSDGISWRRAFGNSIVFQ